MELHPKMGLAYYRHAMLRVHRVISHFNIYVSLIFIENYDVLCLMGKTKQSKLYVDRFDYIEYLLQAIHMSGLE